MREPDVFESPESEPSREEGYWREFFLGVLLWPAAAGGAVVLWFVLTVVAALVGRSALDLVRTVTVFGVIGIGLAQVVFVGPLTAYLMVKGRTATATGLLFAGALAFGFNALCWGGIAVLATNGGRLAG